MMYLTFIRIISNLDKEEYVVKLVLLEIIFRITVFRNTIDIDTPPIVHQQPLIKLSQHSTNWVSQHSNIRQGIKITLFRFWGAKLQSPDFFWSTYKSSYFDDMAYF